MKQILSLGYVLLHIGDEGREFTDKQWDQPLIIRHNGNEQQIFLNVDRARQTSEVKVETSSNEINNSDTEIELVLPIIDEVRDNLNRNHLEQFCKKYSILTTDISFEFRIIDDINHNDTKNHGDESDLISELNKALLTVPEKGIINIDSPATHPISDDKKWTNSDSIWSYKPEEFIRRFENIHDKDKHSIYDVILTFNREGSNIKKNSNNDMTINEFLSLPDKDQQLEVFFNDLRNALDAPLQLSLLIRPILRKGAKH
jgi:hypothetical protein